MTMKKLAATIQITNDNSIFRKERINGFEAWKFQNACRCHGNRQNTQFNTKVNNNLLRLRHYVFCGFRGNGGYFEMPKPQKVVTHLCVKLSVLAVSMSTAGILKFQSLKNLKCSELDKISKCLPLPWKPQKHSI
jgi:hypothetical protein